jgi:hypothetical protein
MTDTRGSSLLHVAFLLKALFVSFSGRVQFVHGEIMHGARRSHMHEATCHGTYNLGFGAGDVGLLETRFFR